jgi:acyl-CoA hydrolase
VAKPTALEAKRETAAAAAARLRPNDTLAVPLGPGVPSALLHALGEREDFRSLRVFAALLPEPYRLFTRAGVRLLSGFFGPIERALAAAGHDVQFVPADFRRFAAIARRLQPRVVASLATPPDSQGRMSLALHAGATLDALHAAGRDPERLLVVEVNPGLPRTLGLPPEHPHALSVEEADVILESDRPVFTLPDPETTPVQRAIAEHIQAFVPEGATLQTGIGGIPSEVAELLAQGPRGGYGVHSEMFTTGLMRLHAAGMVTNRKGIYDGYSVTTFAAGTPELYQWLNENETVRFLPASVVNDPAVIARNRRMVSINGALAVDLLGQVLADTIDGRQHSGIGGHEDFVGGPAFSEGGRSLVCLPSTVQVAGRARSRILAGVPPGGCVTTPRHQVDVVVTEWGAAELAGRTLAERAGALIRIAHPDFRDALREELARRTPLG